VFLQEYPPSPTGLVEGTYGGRRRGGCHDTLLARFELGVIVLSPLAPIPYKVLFDCVVEVSGEPGIVWGVNLEVEHHATQLLHTFGCLIVLGLDHNSYAHRHLGPHITLLASINDLRGLGRFLLMCFPGSSVQINSQKSSVLTAEMHTDFKFARLEASAI
jgi:hypothetical protein